MQNMHFIQSILFMLISVEIIVGSGTGERLRLNSRVRAHAESSSGKDIQDLTNELRLPEAFAKGRDKDSSDNFIPSCELCCQVDPHVVSSANDGNIHESLKLVLKILISSSFIINKCIFFLQVF